MGWPDPSLPQAVYWATEMLSQRHWRHTHVLADQFWKRFIRRHLPHSANTLKVVQQFYPASAWNHIYESGSSATKNTLANWLRNSSHHRTGWESQNCRIRIRPTPDLLIVLLLLIISCSFSVTEPNTHTHTSICKLTLKC